ncbi:uncharacterized protein [Chelonus insularis]|uniref:uncharacterized protein n=1 Tax=Chelonus insularis TaxID=460826 RepID=UPI00158BEE34|nr:uncharacterized protein LOC118066202 [Chelonus insularis]
MYSTRKLFFPLLIGFFLLSQSESSPAHYDQRQTGDLNVDVHFKDVQIVALVDGDLLDYDLDYNYSYDYSDFTIKPITKPTTSSHSSTVKPWVTWPTIPPSSSSSSSSSSLSFSSPSTKSPVSSSAEIPSTTLPSPFSSSDASSTEASTATSSQTFSKSTNADLLAIDRNEQSSKPPTKRCPSGYILDKGRCKKVLRRRLAFFPLAVKLAPKMNQEGTSKDLRVASWISTSV